MMQRFKWMLLFGIVSAVEGNALTPKLKTSGVILLSIDGGKPTAIKAAKMPVLMKLASEGAVTWNAKTTFPSYTLPSHTSMLSGLDPQHTKVTWNEWDPKIGPLKLPTIFSIAKSHGVSTAAFVSKKKFKHFDIPTALDHFFLLEADADKIIEETLRYVNKTPTRLIFIHFRDADAAGHRFGWDSPQQLVALEKIDDALGKLVEFIKLKNSTVSYNLILSADHGGSGKTHGSASSEDTTIPWLTWGENVKPQELMNSISTMDSAATVLQRLGLAIPAHWQGRYVKEAFER